MIPAQLNTRAAESLASHIAAATCDAPRDVTTQGRSQASSFEYDVQALRLIPVLVPKRAPGENPDLQVVPQTLKEIPDFLQFLQGLRLEDLNHVIDSVLH